MRKIGMCYNNKWKKTYVHLRSHDSRRFYDIFLHFKKKIIRVVMSTNLFAIIYIQFAHLNLFESKNVEM